MQPTGFPDCPRCPLRDGSRPLVCLACFERSTGVGSAGPVGCGSCGRPGALGRPCANPWCARVDHGWSVVFSVGVHAGALRRVIAAYKYRSARRWAPVLAALLAGTVLGHPTWFEEFDLLIPMPAYRGGDARRSWDPVDQVFAGMVRRLGGGWEGEAGAVVKRCETPPMQGLSRRARLAVAEGPLRASLTVPRAEQVAGRRIVVIDDVMTGGGTLREVAGALRQAGAAEVAGLVLARRDGGALV